MPKHNQALVKQDISSSTLTRIRANFCFLCYLRKQKMGEKTRERRNIRWESFEAVFFYGLQALDGKLVERNFHVSVHIHTVFSRNNVWEGKDLERALERRRSPGSGWESTDRELSRRLRISKWPICPWFFWINISLPWFFRQIILYPIFLSFSI